MNASEYQAAASRTFNMEQPQQERCNNAILGLIGETGEIADLIKKSVHHGHELNTATLLEEIGDAQWYVAQMCSVFGWSFDAVNDYGNTYQVKRMRPEMWVLVISSVVGRMASTLFDYYCDAAKLSHDDNRETYTSLRNFHGLLLDLANHYGASPSDIWQANIDKLMKRYPNGFSSQASINREV